MDIKNNNKEYYQLLEYQNHYGSKFMHDTKDDNKIYFFTKNKITHKLFSTKYFY